MTSLLFSKKTWFVLSAISLLMMSAVYIYQVNDLVQNVYLRDQNQQKLVKLQEEIKRSEVAVSRSQSLTRIDKVIKDKGFETVSQVEYVQVTDTQVAAAQ